MNTLQENYKNACNAYLQAFCHRHGYDFEHASWVADRPGEIAAIRDNYFVDMQTIVDDINLDAPENEFLKWYDYCMGMRYLGAETTPNFRSWVNGCPRKSPEEIQSLKELKERIEVLKNELIEDLKS